MSTSSTSNISSCVEDGVGLAKAFSATVGVPDEGARGGADDPLASQELAAAAVERLELGAPNDGAQGGTGDPLASEELAPGAPGGFMAALCDDTPGRAAAGPASAACGVVESMENAFEACAGGAESLA
mmetsp:Transcript_6740/g.25318  ORF Transcript_6740/g.25318 Transcript_6740/m.25318 type:complete len:128 (+) Transcript_6740:2437-2820(+)